MSVIMARVLIGVAKLSALQHSVISEQIKIMMIMMMMMMMMMMMILRYCELYIGYSEQLPSTEMQPHYLLPHATSC